MRQYSEKRNPSIHHENIFSSYSGYLHVYNYTKIKGLDLGKITSLPNVFNLHVSLQSSPKINRMLITRLICIQWVSSRIFPQLPQSPLGTPGSMPPFSRRTDRKKKMVAFLESRSAKASKLQILLTSMISLFLHTIHMLREGDVSNA